MDAILPKRVPWIERFVGKSDWDQRERDDVIGQIEAVPKVIDPFGHRVDANPNRPQPESMGC